MELTVDKQTQATIVAAKGKLDAAGAPELETRCKALIQEGANRLLLDFAKVEYVSSAGLRSLLVLARRSNPPAAGSRCAAWCPPCATS